MDPESPKDVPVHDKVAEAGRVERDEKTDRLAREQAERALEQAREANRLAEEQTERIEKLAAQKARRSSLKLLADLDVRGLLAILGLVGGFGLSFQLLTQTGQADIPAWAAAVVTGIIGFYFGSRGGTGGNGYH